MLFSPYKSVSDSGSSHFYLGQHNSFAPCAGLDLNRAPLQLGADTVGTVVRARCFAINERCDQKQKDGYQDLF